MGQTQAIAARRAQEAIPVVNASPLVVFTLHWQVQPGRESRTVVVKGTCDLVPDAPARLRDETDPPSGDVHEGDEPQRSVVYPSDFAIFKPRADVVLRGHAHAPFGSSPAALVRFRFGAGKRGFDRHIAVFGDRRWEGSVVALAPSAARPFIKVPLVYERAYGGPGFDKNPVGTGFGASPGGRLPNLEDPDRLIKSPLDAPEPMSFGAVPAAWRARGALLGTFDARWHKTRWPYFPDDFDWSYFQAAPRAQQLEELAGDEPFELVGMHPDHPKLSGRLPDLSPRCFAQRSGEPLGALYEIVLRLDTIVFDVDAMKLNLVWRGLCEVADDDASDIAELFVMVEARRGARAELDEVRARYLAHKAGRAPVADDPRAPAAPANDAAAPAGAPDAHAGAIRAALAAAAVPTAAAGAALASAAPPASHGWARPAEPSLRERVVALLASGAALEGLDLAGADLSDLDLSSRAMARVNLKGATLRRARFAGANLGGAVLAGADLTDAVLDGASLERADLSGAVLDGASLVGADLTEADLERVTAPRADLRAARGARARLAGANLAGARFERAALEALDLTEATLDEAIFDGASLPALRLYDARGNKASFKDADLSDARADGVCLIKSALTGARAKGSVWERATLDGSSFLGALLVGASFVRASCVGTVFSGADLAEARLLRAALHASSLLRANLMGASLESADLSDADLRGANLHGAETWKANFSHARLDLAIVTQTKLGEKS